jgi:hypothetical protein
VLAQIRPACTTGDSGAEDRDQINPLPCGGKTVALQVARAIPSRSPDASADVVFVA